jgi:hypothetical protein
MSRSRRPLDHMTADRWLYDLHMMLRPWFRDAGYKVPPHIELHCGFPKSKVADGQCFYPIAHQEAGIDHYSLFIVPYIDDPIEVAAVVVHEIIHTVVRATTPKDEKVTPHGKQFKTVCAAVGLVMVNRKGRTEVDDGTKGTPGSAKGRALRAHLEQLTAHLGPYPHKALERPVRRTIVRDKWILLECGTCGLEVRIKELDAEVAALQCPDRECSGPLDKPEKED